MSAKHDTSKVRIHSSTKRSGKREFKQHCVRWYEAGKRKQRCFTTLAEAKAFKLEAERNPGAVWMSLEFNKATADRVEEMANRSGLSCGDMLGKIVRSALSSGFAEPPKEEPVPRGMKLIVRSLGTGQRMLLGKSDSVFLQSVGAEPKEMDLATSVIAFDDLLHSHAGHELGDGARPYLCIVALGIKNGGAK